MLSVFSLGGDWTEVPKYPESWPFICAGSPSRADTLVRRHQAVSFPIYGALDCSEPKPQFVSEAVRIEAQRDVAAASLSVLEQQSRSKPRAERWLDGGTAGLLPPCN